MKKLIASVLIFTCICGLTGCTFKEEKNLLENGPWGSQAIWADDKDQIYLICTKDSDDAYATVTAFLYLATRWQSMECNLKKGTTTVLFNTSSQIVLEANAKMEGEKLYLSDFKMSVGSFAGINFNIELSKFSYEEQIDKLPADIANKLQK